MNYRAAAVIVILSLAGSTAPAQNRLFSAQYDDYFRKYSKRFFGVGFDWRYFKAQAFAESNLNPDAYSHVGAMGIMQLMPSTFLEVSSKNPEFNQIDDPDMNIGAGIFYSRRLWLALKEHQDEVERIRFTLGSYNAGLGRIIQAKAFALAETLDALLWRNVVHVAPKVLRWKYQETLEYVSRIESIYELLRSQVLKPPRSLKRR